MTKILTLDGGGVRGTMTVELLKLLEIGDHLGDSIFNTFDIFSGVSVGSMLACGLIVPSDEDPTKPKYNASQLRDIFMQYVKVIFERTWVWTFYSWSGLREAKYDHTNKLKVLETLFGDLTLSQLLKPVVIPIYDAKKDETKIITTSKYPDMRVVDVVMGSTAAPVYFDRYTFTYKGEEHVWMDGGLGLNNTSVECLTEIIDIHPDEIQHVKICNIGTGVAYEDYSHRKTGGLISYGADLINVFMSATATADIKQCKKLIHDHFLRVNCEIDSLYNVTDITSDVYLQYFIKKADEWYQNEDNINMLKKWIC